MTNLTKLAISFFVFVAVMNGFVNAKNDESRKIVNARIESCSACKLVDLPEVQAFIYDDVPAYNNIEIMFIGGAPPELVLLNKDNVEVERINIEKYNREECNELLRKYGIKKKITKALVESCSGCKLNRLKDVKDFIYVDIPTYSNIEVNFIGGASPELIFMSDDDEEIEHVDLEPLTRKECNDLLINNGIRKKNEDELLWDQSKAEL
ncbi:hypothetical protein RI129_004549 [Pyrocoelia pectoralis]|uniref:Selenoprotein M n=1 Tax=Pyrocoelia pectoralis TaxID=417401 RepID=A0AAN7ZGV0_9COLE